MGLILKKLLCLLLVFIFYQTSFSFESSNSAVHFNKPYYFNGDTAWFKVWVPEEFIEERAIAQASLQELNGGISISNFSLPVNSKGSGEGYIVIPNNISTGAYSFRMTLIDKNTFEILVVITHQTIIISDLSERSSIPYTLSTDRDLSTRNQITLSTDSKVYLPRQEVILNINIRDEQGNPLGADISVSVMEYDTSLDMHDISFSYSDFYSGKATNQIVINETAQDKNHDKILAQSNLLIFMNETGNVIQGTTDMKGRFIVQLEPFIGNKTIQYWDYFGRDLDMVTEDIFIEDALVSEETVNFNKDLLTYLERNAFRKKMNYIFDMNADHIAGEIKTGWQHKPDFSVETKNYEPFKDLKEFMETVITPLKIMRKKDGLEAKMVNPQSKPYFSKEPVFIIDQVICGFNEVLELEMQHIKSIDFYNRPESLRNFGIMGENGIVVIHTSNFHSYIDEKEIRVIYGLLPPVRYPKFVHLDYDKEQPLLGSSIYWNPSLKTDENGTLRLSFNHNDEPGIYKIKVLCKLRNGELVSAEKTYRVKL
ncbi:MAG: hypothetical protein PVH48_10595 [Cyclobacteriaceae bacterium]